MTATVYSFSARRMIRPEPGEVTVTVCGEEWSFGSPKDAIKFADYLRRRARDVELVAKREAAAQGASPLWLRWCDVDYQVKIAEKIALAHGVEVAEIWTRPTPRTHLACAALWESTGTCATEIAEMFGLKVTAVRKAIRDARNIRHASYRPRREP